MRSNILRAALCLLVVLAVPLTLLAFAFGLPAQYGETYLAALGLKWDRLERAEGPRIVVAGGSGAAFALRCDLLEQELPGYAAVNFGLYAGLGTTVMLDLALPRLREGDILIFMPELSAQTLSTYFGAQAMWQAADGRPELLAALPGGYGGALLGAFPGFAAAKARLYRDESAPGGDGIYALASFNSYGDIDAPGREQNRMTGAWDENMPLVFDPALPTAAFLDKVNAVAAVCEKRGIRFYFRFCPMNAAAVAPGEEARAEDFAAGLAERLDCPILGGIDDAVLAPQWFFDTNFHLNAAGAVTATALLARDLKAALGDPAPVGIAPQEMPRLAEAAPTAGDTRDADCFLYEEAEGGVRVTALSEAGATRERLTVPTVYEGQPVLGFDAAVFAGNTRLRELVLQENIQRIADGSFAGCAALERVILQNPRPAACSVGAGLLDGTDALVYVPAASLSAYCTNYFWAVHASRLRALEAQSTDTPQEPEEPAPGQGEILYLANGGRLRRQEGDSVARAMDSAHLRVNTLPGAAYFVREGYVLLGWNTEPDGSGERIGLGSRTQRREGLRLYAQWAAATPREEFRLDIRENEVWILAYTGGGGRCVIPEEIDGRPVRRVCQGAFQNAELETLVLPASLRRVESGAFTGCAIREITLYDSLREIGEESFLGCALLQTLHINAAVSPVYSGSYYDSFSDKYDWLLSIRERKKLVLASGSSGRYGYDSPALKAAFPDYEVANMGVYAYSNALPQLELIRGLMGEGDVLLSAPEFDAIDAQFCVSNRLDAHFWAMMESNYDAAAELDLRDFSAVFASFGEYQRIRSGMTARSYSLSPANYDDDGNYYAFGTYNVYGDFTLPRPNGEKDVLLRHNIADYTVESFPEETVAALNREYARFLDQGVAVYFSYTPRNRSSLTERSTPEARAALHDYLKERLTVPLISRIEDYLLSGVYFWQIDSHTSTEGAAIRTARVIEDLRRYMD